MNNYNLGIYEKAMPDSLTFEEKLLTAKDTGYDFVELTIDQNPAKQERLYWSKKRKSQIRQFMFENEIYATTLSLSALRSYTIGSPNITLEKKGMEMFYKSIDLAYELGSRIVLVNGYDVFDVESTKTTQDRFLDNLDSCTKYAAVRGVTIGLENADKPFADSIEKTTDLVKRINSPFLKVYADIGNATNAAKMHGADPVADLKTGEGYIVAVHLKDTLPGEYRYVDYGKGHVDFAACIEQLMSSSVGVYMAELFLTRDENWKDDLVFTHDFLRKFFNKVAK
jgi:L-ribulose-5-phosphate 3-epimerase